MEAAYERARASAAAAAHERDTLAAERERWVAQRAELEDRVAAAHRDAARKARIAAQQQAELEALVQRTRREAAEQVRAALSQAAEAAGAQRARTGAGDGTARAAQEPLRAGSAAHEQPSSAPCFMYSLVIDGLADTTNKQAYLSG